MERASHQSRRAPCRPGHERGWSLLELLCVVLVIGLILAILLPALSGTRETARRVQCQSHLRNLGLAVQQFESVHQRFPAAATMRHGEPASGLPDPPRHGIFARLLPYCENSSVYRQLDLRCDWNAPVNAPFTRQHLGAILLCPSAPGERQRYHVSDYSPAIRVDPSENSGLGMLVRTGRLRNRSHHAGPDWGNRMPVWDNVLQLNQVDHVHQRFDRRVVRSADVRDGLSHTLLLVENAGKPICYEQGRPADCIITRFRWASPNLWMTINNFCQRAQVVNCSNNSQPYSFHRRGLNVVLADGSVHFLNEQIEADALVSLITCAAGD
jgi:prepilin-type N-terminal cleavage/methylation domain-containing protein